MTNKRYNIKPSNIVEDGFCIQDDEKEHSFPTVDDKSHLIMYEKALNEQNNRIKELEKENKKYRQILLDFGIRSIFKENTVLKDGDNDD